MRNKVIGKIKKLRALGRSPERNESKLAIELANKLIEQYQIKESELGKDDDSEDEILTIEKEEFKHWKGYLAKHAAIMFNCQVYFTQRDDGLYYTVMTGHYENILKARDQYKRSCYLVERHADETWYYWYEWKRSWCESADDWYQDYLLGVSEGAALSPINRPNGKEKEESRESDFRDHGSDAEEPERKENKIELGLEKYEDGEEEEKDETVKETRIYNITNNEAYDCGVDIGKRLSLVSLKELNDNQKSNRRNEKTRALRGGSSS